jgi:hypothetical protein
VNHICGSEKEHSMNAKSKIFGFLVALGLMVSMAGGATAAPAERTVNVNLGSPSVCGLNSLTVSGDFGTWYWNDAAQKYERTSDSSMAGFTGTLAPIPWGGCDVAIGFTGLMSGSSLKVPANTTYFYAQSMQSNHGLVVNRNPAGWSEADLVAWGATPQYLFDLELLAVPAAVAPGIYSGTVTVAFTNAA